jgi:hypothetical protein
VIDSAAFSTSMCWRHDPFSEPNRDRTISSNWRAEGSVTSGSLYHGRSFRRSQQVSREVGHYGVEERRGILWNVRSSWTELRNRFELHSAELRLRRLREKAARPRSATECREPPRRRRADHPSPYRRLNESTRCADVPCVNRSGITCPVVVFCSRSEPRTFRRAPTSSRRCRPSTASGGRDRHRQR